jgi:hypothetical protein
MTSAELPGLSGAGKSTPFHFLTVTEAGLEILGEPSGEKTIVDDIRAIKSLHNAMYQWLVANECPHWSYGTNGKRIGCELRKGHRDYMHYGREFDDDYLVVIGHHFWSDKDHDGKMPERI